MRGYIYVMSVLFIARLYTQPVPNPPRSAWFIARKRTTLLFQLLALASTKSYQGAMVTSWQHALQCAHLARSANEPIDLQIACLFHDIGYAFQADHTYAHATLGARALRVIGVEPHIAQLVAQHEQAKAFLRITQPAHYKKLQQGRLIEQTNDNPMSAQTINEFKQSPLFEMQMALCTYDLQAHEPHDTTLSVELYKDMLRKHLYTQLRNQANK